ncbi:uncharacterized protein LOC114544572 [Dendronephthya gigantea]|uniref:uncharacterized protein LOC114544572 n=1 Tax=Dendronephthya gigantea TaxID=151771 RepID=UPI0010699845|nr:uncharacterized protein LOC114544572 [Dendronephthya gigantea]
MAAIRETYWIPKLRQLVKRVRSECWGCKRFRAVAFKTPAPGYLPKNRTVGETAFEVVGVDFAGPIRYKKTKKEAKAYLVIFACSLSRAIYLELLPNLTTEIFIPCLKRFIARRGRPRVIYSDNGGTFVKATKWLKKVQKEEQFHELLEEFEIKWIFNLSRAPWWGGQFERLIGVVKSSLRKVIGKGILYWNELSEVLLDVETQINRRPLSYVEDDVELPVLTPASFLFQRANHLPELQPHEEEDKDLRKRLKFLRKCKDQLWNRWRREYLTALRERHRMRAGGTSSKVSKGDVVVVQTDEKSRGSWPLAVVTETFPGKDGVTRAVKVKTGKGELERPVQHLYPLELSCDVREKREKGKKLNPNAPTFRQRRDAAVAADARIQETLKLEQ